jgi:hypothetical protein
LRALLRDRIANRRRAARLADKAEYVRFSEALAHHARQEDEILYSAAIVVGRFVAAGEAAQ